MQARFLLATLIAALMLLPVASPLATAFQPISADNLYNYTASGQGVLAADRSDYMNSPYANFTTDDSNKPAVQVDIANYVYQGPGILTGTPTVGFMNDMQVWTTQLGTVYFTYNYDNPTSGYEFEPLPEFPPTISPMVAIPTPNPPETLVGTAFEPIEGWYLAFDIHPPETGNFRGVFVATFSGFDTDNLAVVPKVIFNATNGRYFKLTGIDTTVLANTSRLLLVRYDIHLAAESFGDEQNKIDVNFTVHIIVSFNRATKYVVINQYVDYSLKTLCCAVVPVEIYFGRIAALDANPLSCRSFYGWNYITLPKCSCATDNRTIFMVLSWANTSLDPDFFNTALLENATARNVTIYISNGTAITSKEVLTASYYRSYAVYMAAYPVTGAANFSFAIASLKHGNEFSAVWRALEIDGNYVNINMSDSDGDGYPDGDLALVRLQWHFSKVHTITTPEPQSNTTQKATIVYGIYDINASSFNGGEGGPYDTSAAIVYPAGSGSSASFSTATLYSTVTASNGTLLPSITSHAVGSELAFLETQGTALPIEGNLFKILPYVDVDNDGIIEIASGEWPDGEENVPIAWMPAEELAYQLYNIFQGPCFSKLASFGRADFLVLPATANPMDPAAVAWVQGVVQAYLITYDIRATELYVGAAEKYEVPDLLPFILLPLENVSVGPLTLAEAADKFQAADGRVLLQFAQNSTVSGNAALYGYSGRNYLVVSVAGPAPNLVTRYFNDFAAALLGGQLVDAATGARSLAHGSLDRAVLTKATRIDNKGLGIVLAPAGKTVAGSPGLAVIAIAKDHFNNTGVVIWGWTASDTYWAAYWFAMHYNDLKNTTGYCDKSALILKINYPANKYDFEISRWNDTPRPSCEVLYSISGPDVYLGLSTPMFKAQP